MPSLLCKNSLSLVKIYLPTDVNGNKWLDRVSINRSLFSATSYRTEVTVHVHWFDSMFSFYSIGWWINWIWTGLSAWWWVKGEFRSPHLHTLCLLFWIYSSCKIDKDFMINAPSQFGRTPVDAPSEEELQDVLVYVLSWALLSLYLPWLLITLWRSRRRRLINRWMCNNLDMNVLVLASDNRIEKHAPLSVSCHHSIKRVPPQLADRLFTDRRITDRQFTDIQKRLLTDRQFTDKQIHRQTNHRQTIDQHP
jgi:hypothetical protein